MENCIFCKIISKEIPSFNIWENENFLAFLEINPVNPGHVLLIPKIHQDYLFDLEDSLYSEIFAIAKKLSLPLKNVFNAKKIGIIVEGFDMPHAHIHLIPINKGNELDRSRAKKETPEMLKEYCKRIKKEIEKYNI
jgi:histidine triad (HIT) family protein